MSSLFKIVKGRTIFGSASNKLLESLRERYNIFIRNLDIYASLSKRGERVLPLYMDTYEDRNYRKAVNKAKELFAKLPVPKDTNSDKDKLKYKYFNLTMDLFDMIDTKKWTQFKLQEHVTKLEALLNEKDGKGIQSKTIDILEDGPLRGLIDVGIEYRNGFPVLPATVQGGRATVAAMPSNFDEDPTNPNTNSSSTGPRGAGAGGPAAGGGTKRRRRTYRSFRNRRTTRKR